MVTIVVLHQKNVKLFKSFTQHVIAWFARKGFNIKTYCLYVIWEKQDQNWANNFASPNMHSRTPMACE